MTTDNITASPDLTEAELLAHIRVEIERLGGVEAASEAWDMGVMFLRYITIYGKFIGVPDERFVSALGFERVTLYRPKQDATDD